MSYKTLLFFLILIIGNGNCFSQNIRRIDSLKNAIAKYDSQIGKTIKSDTIKVNLLNEIAANYCIINPTESLKFSQQAIALSQKINFQKGIAESYLTIGISLASKGELQKATIYFYKTRDLCLKTGNRDTLSRAYSELGILFSKQGNFPESLKNSLLALRIYKELGYTLSIANEYVNIGIIYKQQQKYKEALNSYSKSLQTMKNLHTEDADYSRCCIENAIGQVYLKQGKHTQSLKVLIEALGMAKKFEDPYFDGDTNLTIAKNYYSLGDYKKAQDYNTKALDLFKKIQYKSGEADCYISIGLCSYKQGNFNDAIKNTNKGLEIGKETGELEWIKNAYGNLAEIYNHQGNYKLAYTNEVLYKATNDSLFNSEKDKKFTELKMINEFDNQQQALKIQQQKKDTQLELETEMQRNIKYAVMAILFFMSLLTIGIYYNLKRNQKQQKIIEQQKAVVESQNEQIQYSLTQKETLLREIHHRVKNNLQIISSLLNIQSQDIKDENVLSSIQEGQSRVQAMSLIHQNLYQSEHINNVDIESYLKELVAYLSTMFKSSSKSIHVAIETSGIHFDIDTAIPLGLIVNELVSNAYKYAFDTKNQGNIEIIIKSINDIDYEMQVNDNGIGLPDDFDSSQSKSLGLKLVSILSRQLRGRLTFDSTKEKTSFKVTFKDLKLYQASLE